MLKEAEKTNLSFEDIYHTARDFDSKYCVSKLSSLRPVLNKLGCTINENSQFFIGNQKENEYFIIIKKFNDFSVTIPGQCSKDLERLLLAQTLGHFILHSKAGKEPCKVSNWKDSPSVKESFWFAVGLLLKIEDVEQAIIQGFSPKEIANLFFIPEFTVRALLSIISKLNIINTKG